MNGRVQNAVLGCSPKKDRIISVLFQGKPFKITVTQVYDPTTNAEQAEDKWFHEDLQNLLQVTPKKKKKIHHRVLKYKSKSSRDSWSNR